MKKLDSKVAVITGGTSGMGLATAKRFVAEGAYVFIMGRRRRELDAAVEDIGTHVTGVHGDIAKLADLDRLYEIVKAQQGPRRHCFRQCGSWRIRDYGCDDGGSFR
jgi:NAD(P)-dependent dehydrogenase (short-subunit alcohol dehydrogenase family)